MVGTEEDEFRAVAPSGVHEGRSIDVEHMERTGAGQPLTQARRSRAAAKHPPILAVNSFPAQPDRPAYAKNAHNGANSARVAIKVYRTSHERSTT